MNLKPGSLGYKNISSLIEHLKKIESELGSVRYEGNCTIEQTIDIETGRIADTYISFKGENES